MTEDALRVGAIRQAALMPPKKKEKGGKTGKGSLAVLNAIDEPPQPTPGSPFCLSLVLEVSLLDDQSKDTADAGQRPESGGVVEDAQLNDQQSQQLLVSPVFRYTFVNGERITTPSVGLVGSSWTKVDPPAISNSSALQSEPFTPSTPPTLEASGKVDTDGQPEIDRGPPKHIIWRYSRRHQLHGADEDEVALTLDRNPIMSVTLADKSVRAATVQPPGKGEMAQGDGDNHDNVLVGRNFIKSWPLDLSAFLGGETSVSVVVGSVSNDGETDDSASPLGNDCLPNDLPRGYSSSRVPPAPEGFRYIKLCVTLPGKEAASAVASQDPAQTPEDGGTTDGRSAVGDTTIIGSSEGIDGRRKKLFSAKTMERLNPLSITISSVTSLPGVRIEAESLQAHVKPNPFKLLDLHCKPVYVVCRPFPEDSSGESLHPRILWTAGSAQQDQARFEHTSSFLVGPMDRHRLEDFVENSMLSVEVHDRDPRLSAEDQREQVLRLERMVAGGYPEENGMTDFVEEGSESKDNNEEARAAEGNRTPTVKCPGPRDIHEVDELALREALTEAESAGKHTAHGVTSVRLSGLLDQSRQLVEAYSKSKRKREDSCRASSPGTQAAPVDVAPRLKVRSDVCQRKRRQIPKGGVEDWHLSDEERLVRWPGAYLDAGSSVRLRISLARPLRTLKEGSAERTGPATEEPRPFSRAVLVVEYEEGGTLVQQITAAMERINSSALTNVHGSLRTYVLTQEEKQSVADGTLDVVGGFMVIDDDSRTIVLEGKSGMQEGLATLLRGLGRTGPNGQAYRVLENPEVRFSRRLYTSFDADLKKVRLRDPLPLLCQNPEIYDRSKVGADCFDALYCLRMLRKVDRLRKAAEQGLFPTAQQLIQVESKYGESVSVKDISGKSPVRKRRAKRVGDNEAVLDAAAVAHGSGEDLSTSLPQEPGRSEDGSRCVPKQAPVRRKAPTDSKNAPFEEWLKSRRSRDFLAERNEILVARQEEFLERQRKKDEDRRGETVPTDWCYGPHKLNYVGLKKAEMREKLAKDTAATYTYSMDFVSQTVCLVDEFRLKEDEEAASKAEWKTKRGFVWPCPRTRQELITHPKKPSQSRIDTLKEPWIENELNGGGLEAVGRAEDGGGPPNLAWRKEFDTVPSNGKAVFGGLKPSKYERPLDTDMIGSQSRLPRGRRQLEKDPEFFRSVHLVGEGLAREKALAKRRAEELWRSKVVVDDTDFRVGNFSVRDTPLQLDRAKDILHPPINKTAFKIVRNARLPSGKRVSLRAAPVSTFSQEPFVEPEDFTVSIRGNHRERWAVTNSVTGEKEDFYLRLHGDRMKPKSHKSCGGLKHPPLSPSEMHGPRWETFRRKRGVGETAKMVAPDC